METNPIENSELQNKCHNLAENLHGLLKSNNLNANQLAQALDIPMMTIRRLLSGETADPRISTLKLIANYFSITVDSLIEKNNPAISYLKKTRPLFVPKLTWEIAGKITSLNEIILTSWQNWQTISLTEKETISACAFALESRPSMFPRFPQGTVFIFDNEVAPKDGDIVLIKLKKNNELTLRELVIDPPEWQLHPIVEGSNILQYNQVEHTIIGITILTMLFNRKDYN